MNAVGWRAAALRFAVLVGALMLAAAALSLAFAGFGRPATQAVAAGCGLVGVVIVMLGTVLLGLARRADGRVTQLTGIGTLALSVPFLVIALVI